MNANQQKVVRYYTNLESRLGFDYLLGGAKHFGFYPTGKVGTTEKQAQELQQDLVAENLELKKNQTVLDAGCGQGVVSTYLANKYGVRVFGITLVPFEVESARERAKRLGVESKASYQVMDYSAMTFPDNYFDAIYTTETLSHSPDMHKTLREFLRVLKPDGKLALFEYTIAPDERFSPWEREMRDLVIEGSAMMGLGNFHFNQFPEILKNAGFENVKERDVTNNIRPSFYRLYRFARWPYKFVKLFRLQKFFINTTTGYEWYKMADKDLLGYSIFTGNKANQTNKSLINSATSVK